MKKTLVSIGIIFLPSLARACAVCFGKTDNAGLGRAFTWGIAILLGFTFLILAALGMTMYRIEKLRAAK